MTARRRFGAGALVAMAAVCGAPGHVHADAAGPTEFVTEIVSVEPAVPAIELTIEGGDSFVRIAVERGTEVVVLGYDDEPATLIDADGRVFQNRRSFATYYNDERYGTDDIPDIVDNDAPPEWDHVGSGGAWAWHDHRAHWMGTEPPTGMQPGDRLPAQSIPLLVDGRSVSVTVVSTLVADPSPWPSLLGAAAGVGIAVLGALRQRLTAAVGVVALIALAVGGVQFLSLPSETHPRPIWWLPPAIAVAATGLAWWWRSAPLFRDALLAIATAQVLLWAFTRRLTFVKAVLPTDLPFWLDRMLSAAATSGALVALGFAVASLVRLARHPASASSIAASRSS
jgi:hypothetical protein